MDLRRVHAGRPEQARHVHERPRIFLVRRGVHHHERFVVRAEPEVAPKARIPGKGLEAAPDPDRLVEPGAKRSLPILAHRSTRCARVCGRMARAAVARPRPIISNSVRRLPPGSPPTA